MLDARFTLLYFCQSLDTSQRDLSAIAELLVWEKEWLVGATPYAWKFG